MKVFFFIIIHDQQKGEQLVAHRPQLRILTPQGCNEPEELSADALSVRGFEHYRCDDYHLGMTLWLSLLTFSLLLLLLWLLFFLYIKFNPLTATILFVILLTVCHTVLVILVWRIMCWINSSSPN